MATQLAKSQLADLMAFHLDTSPTCAFYQREWRFHATRKWRLDFAWPSRLIALEVEGGTWVGGRHNQPASFARDCEKYNEAAILGWRVLRMTTNMVRTAEALAAIERALWVPTSRSIDATG